MTKQRVRFPSVSGRLRAGGQAGGQARAGAAAFVYLPWGNTERKTYLDRNRTSAFEVASSVIITSANEIIEEPRSRWLVSDGVVFVDVCQLQAGLCFAAAAYVHYFLRFFLF